MSKKERRTKREENYAFQSGANSTLAWRQRRRKGKEEQEKEDRQRAMGRGRAGGGEHGHLLSLSPFNIKKEKKIFPFVP